MKKIMLIALSAVLLIACGSDKSKDGEKASNKTSETTSEKSASSPAATGKDAELTKWLGGKMLVSTDADPKYDMWNNLKLKADGTCTDKDNASATWIVSEGNFVFQSVVNMKKIIEKRAEDTLVFKAEYGRDGVYVLKSIN